LTKLGVPAHEAEYRAHAARAGEALVSVKAHDATVNRAVILLEHHCLKDSNGLAAAPDCPDAPAPAKADPTRPGERERELSKTPGVRIYSQVVELPAEPRETRGQQAGASPVRVIVEVVVRHEGQRPETAPAGSK
jgi:hypothetical protein